MGENPLGYEKESKLLRELAIPCIISMLVSALYNIVFPVSTISAALSLLIGVGGASRFSLKLGAGEKEEAERYAGTALVMMGSDGVMYAGPIADAAAAMNLAVTLMILSSRQKTKNVSETERT